jgi:hypothetical protein
LAFDKGQINSHFLRQNPVGVQNDGVVKFQDLLHPRYFMLHVGFGKNETNPLPRRIT